MIRSGTRRIALRMLSLLLALPVSAIRAGPDNPDIAVNDAYVFRIKVKGDRCDVTGQRTFRLTYLSDRATRINVHNFAEGLHSKIENIEAWCRGEKIKPDRIGVQVPHRADSFFSEQRVFSVAFPDDLVQGESVSYRYDLTFKDIAYLPMYGVPNVDRLEAFELRFEHPPDIRVDFALHFARTDSPIDIARPDAEQTILRIGPLAGVDALPFLVGNEYHVLVLPVITRDGKPINATTPADFAAWYTGQFEFEHDLADSIALPIDAALAALTDDLAKLEVIYDFVRHNFRYISDLSSGHSLLPSPPGEILRNRYGDCKDRVCLMQAIAAREGLAVKFALVGAMPGVAFPDRVTYSQFNHMIGAYETPQGPIFFDPTATHVPFGQLPESDVGQTALVLDGDASYQTTIPPPEGSLDAMPGLDVAITAAADDLSSGRAEIALRRWYRVAAVEALARMRGLELQNFLKGLVGGGFYKVALSDFVVGAADGDAIRLQAAADLSAFAVASPTRLYLPRAPLIGIDAAIRDRADDDFPLQFSLRRDVVLRIRLDAPGYAAAADSMRLVGPGSVFVRSILTPIGSSGFSLDYAYRRGEKLLRNGQRDEFIVFATAYLDHKKDMFILEKVEP